jgi:hypothetical protein
MLRDMSFAGMITAAAAWYLQNLFLMLRDKAAPAAIEAPAALERAVSQMMFQGRQLGALYAAATYCQTSMRLLYTAVVCM